MMRSLFLVVASLFFCTALRAELPPSAYDKMHESAPEKLEIEVLQVDIKSDGESGKQTVDAVVRVEKVLRTATNVVADDIIRIAYTIEERPKGWAGPGEVPLLQENERTIAYLKRPSEVDPYGPAAGRMSFLNF